MIKKVKYDKIDFVQYSECLENACQNADYADKQFLDIVSNRQWFLLVYGDYQAVMPVSYFRKFGLTFILMPKICQQLGVFSKEDDPEINQQFYDFLENNFLVLIYAFNGDNQFNIPVQKKTSYLLQKDNYPTTKKNYSSHRRRNVRIIGDLVDNISLKKDWKEDHKQFFFKNIKGTNKDKDDQIYFEIFKELLEKNIGHLRILEFKNKIQSFVYLYEGKNRRYLSLFINGYPLINPNFPSIMIDHCLQNFIEDKNFDFMGSEVENVAKFNERFGAISYQYPLLTNTKITLLKNLWKKYRIITNFAP
ncbi:hypothetical protein Q73A0000_02950 [Kaistella flava (ex Peng et al. 2021)]|uniref:BioF2-like acetyltransferase domain-containing protein n=1 Tax=Kaistella flava (ex Peng et al. 2021) TaxID=2038776 RepID=A0A7M2Y6D0_9FLAO|nr:hypothetical protein [Kaistella flava (ex Peng et al. 2021)]QOW09389.1 hypothetical protein Q73A0000_02950 [Kaistella flava (ex Peng et al. 2021)]